MNRFRMNVSSPNGSRNGYSPIPEHEGEQCFISKAWSKSSKIFGIEKTTVLYGHYDDLSNRKAFCFVKSWVMSFVSKFYFASQFSTKKFS